MIFERHKAVFKQPGWTRVQICYTRHSPTGPKDISNWVETSYPRSRYYYSYQASAYWFENPVAVTEMMLKFSETIVKVNVIEAKTDSPVEKRPEPDLQPDLFRS